MDVSVLRIPSGVTLADVARGISVMDRGSYASILEAQPGPGSDSEPKRGGRAAHAGVVLAILAAALLALVGTGKMSAVLVRQAPSFERKVQIAGGPGPGVPPPRAAPPAPAPGQERISLFCFCVTRSAGDEPKLIRKAFSERTGIFACDSHSVYSDAETWLVVGPPAQLRTTRIDINLHGAVGGVGTKTASWLNTETFIRAWEAVIGEGHHAVHDWVAKVDPDAVFLPERLRQHLRVASRGDRNGAPPCLTHNCPVDWESGQGGYFCRATRACSPAAQGPVPRSTCERPCYIGSPPLNYSAENETRNGLQPCLGNHICPPTWESGSGGYFCNVTNGCRPSELGPFSGRSCPQQCYIGEPALVSVGMWPKPALYIRNCELGFGFFGALEVISGSGVAAYAAGKARCAQELDYHDWGEDLFMQKCLELLGVGHIDDFGLLSDGYCGRPPSPCVSTSVAFHPFKAEEVYQRCLDEARQKDDFLFK